MNILIVTTEIGLDGGGMSLSCTKIKDLLSKEHNVKVISSTDYPIVTANGGNNILTEQGVRKEYKFKSDLYDNKDSDVVIGFGARYNGYYAALLAERLEKRFILSLRGSDINIAKWSVEDNWYLVEACKRSNKVICLSEEMRTNVLSACPNSNGKVIIIPNSVEGEWIKVSYPNLPDSVVLGCAASHLNEKKGIGNLLCMIEEFKKISSKSIRLELVGDVDDDLMQSYLKIINSKMLQKNIVFIKRMGRDQLKQVMNNWDFYIQGSVCEGHPNSIVECLQEGHAFISSPTGFVAEILKDKFPELFFETWNPKDMALKIKEASDSLCLVDSCSQAQRYLADLCRVEKIEKKWLGLFSYDISFKNELTIEHVHAVALHDIQGELHDSITTPIDVFNAFVKFVFEHGYRLCSMKEYLESSFQERKSLIVCTFDDGYRNLVENAMPILSQYDFSATVFICTSLIGKDNKWNNKDATLRHHLDLNDIRILIDNKWEIASHGVTHRNLLKLSDLEIESELSESKLLIDQLVGYSITYAYPYGAFNKFIQHCVEKYFKFAFAVSQGGTSLIADKMQIKRYSITEIYQMIQQS